MAAGLVFMYDGVPQRVLFGSGMLARLGAELERVSITRLLLIAGGAHKGVADDLAVTLGDVVVARLHEVRQHVPEALAANATQVARDAQANGIVTVGGGSATGLGKAVAHELGIPLVAVPTTYAGSEATAIYGITGQHKQTGRDERVLPKVVIYDPALTASLPPHSSGTTGFNAMAHCVEALYAPGANPVSSLLALEGLRRLSASLPRVTSAPSDMEARSDALYGAYLAGSALAVAGTALHHKLCHVLGGTFGLDHGEVNAVLLPYVTAFNAPAASAALRDAALAVGGAGSRATDTPARLRALAVQLDLPLSLVAIGMPAHGLDNAARLAVDAVGSGNPRAVDATSLRKLLDDAYAGRWPAEGEA